MTFYNLSSLENSAELAVGSAEFFAWARCAVVRAYWLEEPFDSVHGSQVYAV